MGLWKIFIWGLLKFSYFHIIGYRLLTFSDLSMKYGQIHKKIIIIVLAGWNTAVWWNGNESFYFENTMSILFSLCLIGSFKK